MTGREGELVRRKDFGPAMLLEVARSLPFAGFFYDAEENDGCSHRRGAGGEGHESRISSKQQYADADRVPDPAVSQASRPYHPEPQPSRRTPTIQTSHYAMIAGFDEPPNHSSGCHDDHLDNFRANVQRKELCQLLLTLRHRPPDGHGNGIYPTAPAPDEVEIHKVVDAHAGRHECQQRGQQDRP